MQSQPDFSTIDWLNFARSFLDDGQEQIAHGAGEQALIAARSEGSDRNIAEVLLFLAENALWFPATASFDPWKSRRKWAREGRSAAKKADYIEGQIRCEFVLITDGPFDNKHSGYEDLLEKARAVGSLPAQVHAARYVASERSLSGDKAGANRIAREAYEIAVRLGDQDLQSAALAVWSLVFSGRNADRRALFRRRFAIHARRGQWQALIKSLIMCAVLACGPRDSASKRKYLLRARRLAVQHGFPDLQKLALTQLIDMKTSHSSPAQLRRLVDERDAIVTEDNSPPPKVKRMLEHAFESGDHRKVLPALKLWTRSDRGAGLGS